MGLCHVWVEKVKLLSPACAVSVASARIAAITRYSVVAMTMARLRTGLIGEQIAAERLLAAGYTIVARNASTRAGELDLIVLRSGTLAFVEVKTMRSGARAGPPSPVMAVGPRKQLQVRRLARAWLAEGHSAGAEEIRFDVIGITIDPGGGVVTYEHIEAAF